MEFEITSGGKLNQQLIIIGREIDAEARALVNDITDFAYHRMKENVPYRTGNLRDSVQRTKKVTPARNATGEFISGNNYEGRVYFGESTLQDGRDPRAYVLALNDGTREVIRPPGHPLVMNKEANAGTSGAGGVIFRMRRAAQPGMHFIEKTEQEVSREADIRVARFLREKAINNGNID